MFFRWRGRGKESGYAALFSPPIKTPNPRWPSEVEAIIVFGE
jgi:hypothetical protein